MKAPLPPTDMQPSKTLRRVQPGRDTAPSGAPAAPRAVGGEGSLAGAAAYIVRCAAGSPELPAFYPQGKYLGWVAGHFIPCCKPCFAKRYTARAIARAVATRAESVYPGSRFEVEAVGDALRLAEGRDCLCGKTA